MPIADIADAEIYYLVEGHGPPLLLIAGLGSTHQSWESAIPPLTEHFTTVRFDNRGCGETISKRIPRHIRDFSCDTLGLMDELGYRKMDVLGISLGGIIAQQFAIDFPERVNRLVLISTTCGFSPYLRQIMTMLGTLLRRAKRVEYRDSFTTLGHAPEYIDAHPEIHAKMRDLSPPGKINRRGIAAQLRALASSQIDKEDYRIKAPTLLIGGTHDVIIPHKYHREIHELIPGSTLVSIPQAGHGVLEEEPEIVRKAILDFLLPGSGSKKGRVDQAQAAT